MLLLLAYSLSHYSPVHAVPSSQPFSTVYLSPVSHNATKSSFIVNVMLNLAPGQNISGFDVMLHYSNPQPNPVIRAENMSYSVNIFGDASSNLVSNACVPLGSNNPYINCGADPHDEAFGWVHFSELTGSGLPIAGPLSGPLFSVGFNATGLKGSSLITVSNATLGNAGSGPYASPQLIPVATEDAIFSTSGVAAFFNYIPTDTPSIVAGHAISFNGTGSFNADNASIQIQKYAWSFGDVTTNSTADPFHRFLSPGTYNVTLTVTDVKGNRGSISRIVVVGPALGALLLTVYSLQRIHQTGVLVRIFNSSATLPFANATTDPNGEVYFTNLTPGTYTLALSGQYAKNSTVTEAIIAGWTTQDNIGIEVDAPPISSPSSTPWYGNIVFLASLGVAMGLFVFGLILRRKRMKKQSLAR